ncbi:hypothetical protein ACP70R_038825 [Stipagrostis hirtigluma subsp. patula]
MAYAESRSGQKAMGSHTTSPISKAYGFLICAHSDLGHQHAGGLLWGA